MSTYLVSRAHIDQLVRTAMLGPSDGAGQWSTQFHFFQDTADGGHLTYTVDEMPISDSTSRADAIGRMLWVENLCSIEYRYPDVKENPNHLPGPIGLTPQEISTYTYTPPCGSLSIAEVLKAIDCYEYQSCEHPEWKTSAAKAFCDALTRDLIAMLPGYDAAPWSID